MPTTFLMWTKQNLMNLMNFIFYSFVHRFMKCTKSSEWENIRNKNVVSGAFIVLYAAVTIFWVNVGTNARPTLLPSRGILQHPRVCMGRGFGARKACLRWIIVFDDSPRPFLGASSTSGRPAPTPQQLAILGGMLKWIVEQLWWAMSFNILKYFVIPIDFVNFVHLFNLLTDFKFIKFNKIWLIC